MICRSLSKILDYRFYHPSLRIICYNSASNSAAHSKFHWCDCSDRARAVCLQRVKVKGRREPHCVNRVYGINRSVCIVACESSESIEWE